jgi:hypothetical protein
MKVTLLQPDDLMWPLGSQDSTPQYQCGVGSYRRSFKVDPYPAYAHDVELVEGLAAQCEERFPLSGARIGIWLLSHDFIDRVNGVTFEDYIYNREDGTEWKEEVLCHCGCGEMKKFSGQALTIVLSGKRIPIHPAISRYLVTHEYGHAVFDYIARRMGYDYGDHDKLKEEYMKLRGLENYTLKYSGGKWHAAPGEIIANDFRVLFTKQEIEFWPHECALPNWYQPEGLWWKKAAELCGVKLK